VLARNYRARNGEVDLICRSGKTIVFVEVKTRGPGSLAAPLDAVTPTKRARIIRAASAYLSENDLWEAPCRFDVAALVATGDGFAFEHIENAFGLEGGGDMYQPF